MKTRGDRAHPARLANTNLTSAQQGEPTCVEGAAASSGANAAAQTNSVAIPTLPTEAQAKLPIAKLWLGPEELLAEFPVPANPALSANWEPFAVAIYRNWLSILSAQKQRHSRPAQYMAALRLDQTPAPAG